MAAPLDLRGPCRGTWSSSVRSLPLGNETAFYVVVAHEMGHAAQARFIYDGEGPVVLDQTSVCDETQADCIAGATVAAARRTAI